MAGEPRCSFIYPEPGLEKATLLTSLGLTVQLSSHHAVAKQMSDGALHLSALLSRIDNVIVPSRAPHQLVPLIGCGVVWSGEVGWMWAVGRLVGRCWVGLWGGGGGGVLLVCWCWCGCRRGQVWRDVVWSRVVVVCVFVCV